MLVKCTHAFYSNCVQVGKIYDAEPCQPGARGNTIIFYGYTINHMQYSAAGFRELTAIEKLKYFNRRNRERNKKSPV